ncbi:DUF1380 family protein (plasmid) [Klebsiella sp. WOUb02]|uniref:DUF1380 family protein n=1 Tax=Klebsiella sp. WOUb02 TaxID=3161071 RepID=UPI003CFAF4BA
MYGTVNEVCENLKSRFPQNEEIKVIVWTTADVMAVLSEENITEAMAARILAMMDGMEGLHESGVGVETLLCIRDALEEEDDWQRQITVPAAVLKKVMALAGEFLRITEIESGEGAARRLYNEESDALQRVRDEINR